MTEPRDVLHYHLLGGRTMTNQMAPSLLQGERKFLVEDTIIMKQSFQGPNGLIDTGSITGLATGLKPNGSCMVQEGPNGSGGSNGSGGGWKTKRPNAFPRHDFGAYLKSVSDWACGLMSVAQCIWPKCW